MGTLEAGQFTRLARLARVYGSGCLYTTIQQNLVLRWVGEDGINGLYSSLRELGLAAGANTIDDVTACPGTDSCKSALTATAGLGRALSANRHTGEAFNAFVDRVGQGPFAEILADLQDVPPLGPDTIDRYQDWERHTLYRVERGEGECSA